MPERGLSDEEYFKINQVLAKEFHVQHVTLQVEQGQKKFPCSQSLIC